MTRTRLRGLEIAGIQMGIEVPESYPWTWPEGPMGDFSCPPREPEVHVGIRVAELGSGDLGGDRYGMGAWTFEVARQAEGWLLGLSHRGVREQLATFDEHFRSGEILLSPAMARTPRFPLRTPFDEWIVLHRTVARGGLCLNGVARRGADGQAEVRLGGHVERHRLQSRWVVPRVSLFGRDTVLIREEGGVLRYFSAPWSDAMDSRLGSSSAVTELNVVEETIQPFRESLDPDDAADLLVAHAVLPVSDDELLDRVLCNARRISERVKIVRCGDTVEREPSLSWIRRPDLSNGFARPRPHF